MFINCPHCHSLIATDPATDRPPHRCPRCAAELRDLHETASTPAPAADPEPIASTLPAAADAPAAESTDTLEAFIEDRIESNTLHESADAIAETLLGPAAVEVEIAQTNAGIVDTPADATHATPAMDAQDNAMPTDTAADRSSPRPESGAAPIAAANPAAARPSKPAPSFVRGRNETVSAPRSGHWKPIAAIVGLVLLLLLQLLLADRARLAADARWRPLLTTLCGVLRCDLPAWREPAAFTLLSREVRPHPSVPGALRVSASFRNDARWPQPWPRLQLTLSDVDGRAAGMRSFQAREYLGDAPTQNELASGQSATVAMDILEPAPNIVAFDFEFR